MNDDLTGKIKVNDDVRVFDLNGKRRGQPEGGWPGVVMSVGRKLFSVVYPGHGSSPQFFRLETSQANDNYGHQWVKTLEQAADDSARDAAIAGLMRCGLCFTGSGMQALYSTSQLEELAAVAIAIIEKGPDNG